MTLQIILNVCGISAARGSHLGSLYFRLAGNLYEATRNETYKTIGMQTVSFMGKTMHNGACQP